MDNFNCIAVFEDVAVPITPIDDFTIALDGDHLGVKSKFENQSLNRCAVHLRARRTVDDNRDGS